MECNVTPVDGEKAAVKEPSPPHCPVVVLEVIDPLGATGVPVFPPEDVPFCTKAEGDTREETDAANIIENDVRDDALSDGVEVKENKEVCVVTPHQLAVDKGVKVLEGEILPRGDLEGEAE